MKKVELKTIKDFIEDYYLYTTEISTTEEELFSNYVYLEDYITHKEVETEDYYKEVYKDLLYNLVFAQDAIEQQIKTDLDEYDVTSSEYKAIKEFFNKYKSLFAFNIDFTKYEK